MSVTRKIEEEACPSCGWVCLRVECPGCEGSVLVCSSCGYRQMRDSLIEEGLVDEYGCQSVLYEHKGKAYQGWCFGEDELL